MTYKSEMYQMDVNIFAIKLIFYKWNFHQLQSNLDKFQLQGTIKGMSKRAVKQRKRANCDIVLGLC